MQEPGFDHRLHLDYETYSECDIKKAGAYAYARHPSTEVLMLGWAVDDGPVQLWVPKDGRSPMDMPQELYRYLMDPKTSVHAFNAPFERGITEQVLGITIPLDRWRCTQVESFYLGFTGRLKDILNAIGLPNKDDRGDRLINVFSKPAPKNHKADRYTAGNKPEDWLAFCQYCMQDVEVERNLWHWLRKYPTMQAWDWEQWQVDQRINDRGVHFDIDMADSAHEVWRKEKEALTAELLDLTGLEKVTRDPFRHWLEEHLGYPVVNLRKDYLQRLQDHIAQEIMDGDPSYEPVYHAIDLWSQKEGKAVSKYTAAQKAVGDDDRARGMFQYKGAARTDRAGGRIIQLQNLRRPFAKTFQDIATAVDAIKLENPALLRAVYPQSVSDTLGGSVRHMVCAEHNNALAVCDLSSIESVVLGWLTQCDLIDQTFRQGRDTYKVFGEKFYAIPYDEITKEQRTFSKPPVLGCGYMLGWKGLILYAEGMGVTMAEKEAKRAVDTFREMYPEIVAFWDWIYQAIKYVTQTSQPLAGYRMTIERDADFLRIWLPSGRAISYYQPEIRTMKAPWAKNRMTERAGDATYDAHIQAGWTDDLLVEHGLMEAPQTVDNFTYMGTDDKNRWVRIAAHAGGITENIVQSIAGDLLWNGIMNAERADLPVVLHVHDEIGAEVPAHVAESALGILQECMTRQPPWCQDMWLGAAGYVNNRYTKD